MAKLSTDELLDAFKEMTLLELSEFVKEFEDTFGVTAAAPVAVAAAAPAGGGAPPRRPEQDEFDVILEAAGDKKIQVIKEVRAPHQPRPQGGQGPRRGPRRRPSSRRSPRTPRTRRKEALEGAGATVTVK